MTAERDPRLSLAYRPFLETFLAKILEDHDLTPCETCGEQIFNPRDVRTSRRKTKCGPCRKADR